MSLATNHTNNSWFSTWFDSPFYHILYAHRDNEEAQSFIDYFTEELHIPQDAKVLDVACGKGRHSRYLFEKGFNVTGIDLSNNSIAYAKQHRQKGLDFQVHDMRQTFQENSFDLVLNLFTSFGYFGNELENLAVLSAIKANLKPHGQFLIDYLNVPVVVQHAKKEEIKVVDGIEFHIRRQLANNTIVKSIEFTDQGTDYHFEERVDALYKGDFERLIANAGLEITNIYGNYKMEEYKAASSPRLIITGKKL